MGVEEGVEVHHIADLRTSLFVRNAMVAARMREARLAQAIEYHSESPNFLKTYAGLQEANRGILESNTAMNRGMEAMNGRIVKRYRLYEKPLVESRPAGE